LAVHPFFRIGANGGDGGLEVRVKYRPNPLRALWRRGKAAVGPLVTLPSPAIAELFGLAGFDFVFIDCEHGPMGEETALAMMQAVGGTPAVPLIRVPWGEAWLVPEKPLGP